MRRAHEFEQADHLPSRQRNGQFACFQKRTQVQIEGVEKVHRQKRVLCQSYRQARKRQFTRVQARIQLVLERLDKLHLYRETQHDG